MLVIFPLVKSGTVIQYPDDISLFSKTEKDGNGNLIAEYSGSAALTEYTGVWPLPASLPKDPLTILQFRNRFTQAEKVAIYTAAESNIEIKIWLDDLNAATEVRVDDPLTIAGVQALETAGLIGTGRAAEILA